MHDSRKIKPRVVSRLGGLAGIGAFAGLGGLGAWDAWDPPAFTALVNALIADQFAEVWRIVANHNEGYPNGGGDVSTEIQQAYASHPVAQEWFGRAYQQAKSGQLVDPPWPKIDGLGAQIEAAKKAAAQQAAQQTATSYQQPGPAPAPSYSPSPAQAPAPYSPSPTYAPPPTLSPTYYPPASYAPPPPPPSASPFRPTTTPAPGAAVAAQVAASADGTIELPFVGRVPSWAALGLGGAVALYLYRRSKNAS